MYAAIFMVFMIGRGKDALLSFRCPEMRSRVQSHSERRAGLMCGAPSLLRETPQDPVSLRETSQGPFSLRDTPQHPVSLRQMCQMRPSDSVQTRRCLSVCLSVFAQRDVPGFTRAALPVLASNGVRAVWVGVNGGSAPPGVPHFRPFIWRDDASGAEVVAMWHPGTRASIRPML
jgi:hypothetical protein